MIRLYTRLAFSIGRSLPYPVMHVIAGVLLVAPLALLLRYAARARHLPALLLHRGARAAVAVLLLPDTLTTPRRRAKGKQPLSWVHALGGSVDLLDRLEAPLLTKVKESKPKRSRVALLIVAVAVLLPLGGFWASHDSDNYGGWRRFSERLFARYEDVASWSGLDRETMP